MLVSAPQLGLYNVVTWSVGRPRGVGVELGADDIVPRDLGRVGIASGLEILGIALASIQ